jgi:hypothetical protein
LEVLVLEVVDVELEAFVGLGVLAMLVEVVVLKPRESVSEVVVGFVDEVVVTHASCTLSPEDLEDGCDSTG